LSPARITFLVHRAKDYTVRKYLASWGQEFESHVRIRHYPEVGSPGKRTRTRVRERLQSRRTGPLRADDLESPDKQTVVFTDLERLDAEETKRVEKLYRDLQGRQNIYQILNHPSLSLRRYQLLRELHDQGLNRFNAYRVSEQSVPERWPVFLREENDHGGHVSPLLTSQAELDRELTRLSSDRGSLNETLMVEFCDVSDAKGIVRKYGAFRVADRILARQIHFSREWMVKIPDIKTPESAQEELEYVRENPHAEQVMEIFEIARIDYGRIDYGVVDGRIQVWEINTNPMVLIPKDREDPLRAASHDHFGRTLNATLRRLCGM